MELALLGMVVIVFFTYYIAKSAGENGKSAIGWGVLSFLTGFFFQWIFPIVIAVIIGMVLILTGTEQSKVAASFTGWGALIGMGGMVLSALAMFVIYNKASELPDIDTDQPPPPPPPPKFDNVE